MSLLLFQVHSTACVTLSLCPPHSFDHTFGDVSDFFSGTFQCPVHKTDHFDLERFFPQNYRSIYSVFTPGSPKKRDRVPCSGDVKLWR